MSATRKKPKHEGDDLVIRHRFQRSMHIRETPLGESTTALIYVHGLGESGLEFDELMKSDRLGRWRQLASDMPGYGKSPWTEEPLGLEDHTTLLAEWIQAEIPTPVVVVGHSMGGVIGISLCERLGSQVRGFVNIEGNISLADCGFSNRVARQSQDRFVAEGFQELLDGLYVEGMEDKALRTYFPSMRLCDPRVYHRNSVELVEHSGKEQLARRMAALEPEKIYLLGHPRGTGAESQALLDQAGINWKAIHGAGHWPFLDQTDAFLDEVLPFLDKLES